MDSFPVSFTQMKILNILWWKGLLMHVTLFSIIWKKNWGLLMIKWNGIIGLQKRKRMGYSFPALTDLRHPIGGQGLTMFILIWTKDQIKTRLCEQGWNPLDF